MSSAVPACYYLRILVVMYVKEPGQATVNAEPLSPGLSLALTLPSVGRLAQGIFPSWVLGFVGNSSNLVK
ncbi:MAG TPA: hypothetical protein VNY05_17305 [Candidatus Acidoferrales bacterium]|nr:hypothetical protein [Candidatus Acidoferrales bacterium]